MEDKVNKFEETIKLITKVVDAYIESNVSDNKEAIKMNVINLLNNVSDGYVLIMWPESQDYMHEHWFRDESILALGSEDRTGSSAYFVPIKRLM